MALPNDSASQTYRIRSHHPGDIDIIISQHGSQYAKEFGWAESFEAYTARLAADFLEKFDPAQESVFIAELVETSKFLGSIALFKHREQANVAHLRLLLVDPAARGMGLGATLINECVLFARKRGYSKIILGTFSVLEGARRLYRRAGFQLMSTEEEKEYWGVRLVPEIWELPLSREE
ncbi:acyl-CoA N-acyltransferase [Xylaria palmicola]|nr:acyl-CoA N-acyltransferase [Xylaria palmicola]